MVISGLNKHTMRQFSKIWLLFCMLLVVGCSNYNARHKDMQKYIEEVKSRPPQPVDPIPSFVNYAAYKYSASDLRDPFTPPTTRIIATGVQPDIDRPKEKLEAFPLDSLRMVGTLGQDSSVWALIAAPDGAIYRITGGGHLGQNYGKVESISKKQMEIVETVPDGLGGWKKRKVTIKLSDQ